MLKQLKMIARQDCRPKRPLIHPPCLDSPAPAGELIVLSYFYNLPDVPMASSTSKPASHVAGALQV
ncbi:MAG TPA: hypothetical protein PKJ56_04705 [Promineifilum sp.]|nr:hypothetical protein [Promineifilum sp.]